MTGNAAQQERPRVMHLPPHPAAIPLLGGGGAGNLFHIKTGVAHTQWVEEMCGTKLVQGLTGYPLDNHSQNNEIDIAIAEFAPQGRNQSQIRNIF